VENIKNSLEDRVNPRMLESAPMQRCKLGECHGACCIFGVWVDEREKEDILRNSALIAPHMPPELRDPAQWFAGFADDDEHAPSGRVVHTAVETQPDHYGGTACIFWRSDAKCALQVAGVENGLHPWRFKPFYCILHPLDLDDRGRITVDNTADVLAEEGSCLVPAASEIPLAVTFADELKYLLGDRGYQALMEKVQESSTDMDKTPAVQIRPLTPADQRWLESFIIDHWGAKEVVVHKTIYLPALLPGFAAESDGEIAGVVTYQMRGEDCELVTLNCIDRCHGIGTLLLQSVEEIARQSGCRKCWLVTTNDNLDGLRFYQRRGYRLAAIHYGAVTAARAVKPAIPVVGEYGITLQDEVVLEKQLKPLQSAAV
jgi:N-acetylglutamate synthase-like GNAT family acetyltransferase